MVNNLSKSVINSFPFTDKAKGLLSGMKYAQKSYATSSEVAYQGGDYDPSTGTVSVDLGNKQIPVDQQKLVMAHEMLNAVYPKSLAYSDKNGFNSIWEELKNNGDADTKQWLSDIDKHMAALGYDKLGNTKDDDLMTSSRFSYLGQEITALSDLPKGLQKYYSDYIK